uniref:Transposon TX1 uncharacterized n=1 Tax=Cajanus cajan TaxID=3821 RepID=A0A151RVK1_CAJCA|nr:Transposon TX1 uncharacterized [Cajanus cajan]
MARASQFVQLIDDCNLLDLGATGLRFTWYRNQLGSVLAKRLDRALCDTQWQTLFPNAFVENLCRVYSDHCPLLVRCGGLSETKKDRPFRFQAAWATHKGFKKIVKDAWIRSMPTLVNGLNTVRKEAIEFNRNVFGNIFLRKREIQARLNGAQLELEKRQSKSLTRLETKLQEELNEVCLQEEFLWFQKSREKWVRFGDRNTTFFHAQTLSHRRRNKIRGLFLPDGTWHTELEVLQREAIRFYRNLFSDDSQGHFVDMQYGTPPQLGAEAVTSLLAPITKEEVRRAVMSMKSFKAPGPDGFQPFFFKQYWSIVGDELWRTVNEAFVNGSSDSSLLETLMVLIPKVDHPMHLKEFRPISLCNVAFKVISKVIVARIRPFLNDIIGPFQGSFILGRGATDNSILAQEAINFIQKDKSKRGSLALKIDLEKAYDRINWNFLQATLWRFGFPERIIKLIMWGVTNSSLSVLWNGSKLPSFAPTRGLRQGDPLSPYLFVLCMERLALRINELNSEGC